MSIKFPCPHCRRKLEAKDEQAERTLKCPNPACQKPVTVPKTAAEWLRDQEKFIDFTREAGVDDAGFHHFALVTNVMASDREDILDLLADLGLKINAQLMCHAATGGYLEAMKWLKKKGIGIDVWADKGGMPIHLAAVGGHCNVVNWLLQEGVDVNIKGENGKTPLHLAAATGQIDVMRLLVNTWKANVKAKNNEGYHPIHHATLRGQTASLKCLVKELGANVNEKEESEEGWTPLHIAVLESNIACMKYLVEKLGANVNEKNKAKVDGTPLHLASVNGDTASIECLVKELNADVNAENNANVTPLFAAALVNQVESMECLFNLCKGLGKKLELELKNRGGMTLWKLVDGNNHLKRVADWLSDKEKKGEITKPVPKPVSSEITNIFEAAERGTVGNVRYFIEQKGVAVDVTNENGSIPLHFAVYNPDIDVTKYLVSQGDHINIKNAKFGNTPLHGAVYNPNIEITKYLVSKGAKVDTKNNDGNTPLYLAARDNSNVEFLQYLISQGADVNAICFKGNMPIHIAAQCNTNVDILKCLIDHNADVNSNTQIDGCTPLALAVIRNPNVEISKCLVDNGANVNVIINGMTLRDCADNNSNPEVLRYIISVT